ncbi:hypothetical protein IR083_09705 [Dysgonomonas sp. GY75]|uniref:hypothetical protein n=1 Tax=Dysgonomonas sp. GY75 TaxID=2780419 RepID=UPI0018848556|nr:hypothetical protein [Dysgonomonas sp. GY75]MBF0649094.1 hypothetical protein [Dysgonomonas sp. GY75]
MNVTSFEIFTAIGSFLGIIAFLMNFLNPISDFNKKKWDELKSIISLEEMKYYSESFDRGMISNNTYSKISNLIYTIRKEIDFVHFKGYSGKRAKSYLRKMKALHYECTDMIQEPYWFIPTDKEFEDKRYILNKDYFYKGLGKGGKSLSECDKAFRKHIDSLTDKIDDMYGLYEKVEKELNKIPHEQLKFW